MATVLGGCGSDSSSPLAVSTPTPSSAAVAFCQRLHAQLPDRLDGRRSVDVTPTSLLTAAWGDKPVVLRCGVGKPAGLQATSEVIEIDGVRWFLRERPDAYVFTTIGRAANVQVRVPLSVPRTEATGPLVDLASVVTATVPTKEDIGEGP